MVWGGVSVCVRVKEEDCIWKLVLLSLFIFLFRQDSAVLLEGLVTVGSKNPNYYTPDLEASSLANLKTRIIPCEKLKLLDEIGEGAFGKVYKGMN